MRKLLGLIALLTALGVFAVAASGAGAEELPAGAEEVTLADGTTLVIEPAGTGEVSPLSLSQCPGNAMCVWSNNDFTGNFSFWNASETGCHNHEGNPNLRSGVNQTGLNVELGGTGDILGPGSQFRFLEGGSLTGLICFPPR